MKISLLAANIIPMTVIAIGTAIFLAYAFPRRRERPQFQENGYCFLIPFLLTPFTFIFYPFTLLPLSLLASIVVLFVKSKRTKNIVFSATAGGFLGYAAAFLWVYFLNTND